MYHCSVVTYLGNNNFVYTKLFKCDKKTKIKYFNSPRNVELIVLDYWPKKFVEDFHLLNPRNINLSYKYTAYDVNILTNIMVKHVNCLEEGMIRIQEKFIKSENDRLTQYFLYINLSKKIFQLKIPPPIFWRSKRYACNSKTINRNCYNVSKCTEQCLTIYGINIFLKYSC